MNIFKKIISWIICVGVSLAAGGIGSLATTPKVPSWYSQLDKPFFSPPSAVFAPVWTTLYVLMGTALFLVIGAKETGSKKRAYIAYGVQLTLNTLWSLVFFGLESPWLGVVVIVPLLAAIAWTMREFYKHNKTATYLLITYICWVSFATCLNLAVAVKN